MTSRIDAHSSHWQDDDLLSRIYGLEPAASNSRHALESCPECVARYEALEARRREFNSAGTVSEDLLRAQRQAIYAKIESRQRWTWGAWKVPVGATALAITLGVLLQQPAPKPPEAPPAAVSDAQFFSEVASLASDSEPRAAQPIRGLFSDSE